MEQYDLFQAKKFLDAFDKSAADGDFTPTDDQREARDKLEWVINNAHKLQTMFFGRVDQASINDVKRWHAVLVFKWRKPDGSVEAVGGKPAHTIH